MPQKKTSQQKAEATPAKRQKSSTERIFGPAVMSHGFTGVPNILVRGQKRLGLNTAQFNILVQLLSYWMDPAKPPFPSKRKLLELRISEIPDRDFTKSRTAVSVIPGQLGCG